MADERTVVRSTQFKDITGEKFHRLTAVRPVRVLLGLRWLCVCECGGTTQTRGASLKNGNTKSCGCLQKEIAGAMLRIHGLRGVDGWSSWKGIKTRCYGKNNPKYPWYGGRGITVCERWRKSFPAFLEDMGPRPSKKHSIDRIDNNGNYEPSNCRWATAIEQANNRRPRMLGYKKRHRIKDSTPPSQP